MKILFLDMDGVMNSRETFIKNHAEWQASAHTTEDMMKRNWPLGHISSPMVARLNTIVEKTGCKIVISSSWRILCEPSQLGGWLEQKGFLFKDSILGRTGRHEKHGRGAEIQEWLDAHPKVTKYAILDDDSFDIIGAKAGTFTHPNNFVHTNFDFGLQDVHVEKVIDILNSQV